MASLYDPTWLAECRERAPGIVADFTTRIGEGRERLARPACLIGCRECVRECAVRQIAAGWWDRQHKAAERLGAAHDAAARDLYLTRVLAGRA